MDVIIAYGLLILFFPLLALFVILVLARRPRAYRASSANSHDALVHPDAVFYARSSE